MASKAAVAMARPAPPGRRRTGGSRNVSSMSLSSSNEGRSSSPSIAIYSMDQEKSNSGGGQHYSSSSVKSIACEIPFEEVEKALTGLSREDLVLALKRAKEQMDILDSKMDVFIERNEYLESKVSEMSIEERKNQTEMESLQIALQQREERVDELMREQDREEDEVYAKEGIIERLRKRLVESEKSRIEAERRYLDQTTSADKERQIFSDMESLLQTQKAKASTAHERLSASNHELTKENQRLQNLVLQLRTTSHNHTLMPDRNSGDDLLAYTVEGKGEGDDSLITSEGDASLVGEQDYLSTGNKGLRSLQDEAKVMELEALQTDYLVLQKTHDMIQAQMHQLQADLASAKSVNAELSEQNEIYMNILQEKTFSGALIQESAMFNGRYRGSETEESEADDVDDVPDQPRLSKRGKARLTAKRSQELQSMPTSLANEMESSESTDSSKDSRRRERRRERSEVLTDNIEELHKEIWNLRDANQALTLYVSKILDRIISREGYENVLAIDGDPKSKMGTLRNTPNRTRKIRPSSIETLSPPIKPSRTINGNGGGLLSFMGSGSGGEENESEVKTPTVTSHSFVSRAKRGASMDWRSLVGATSSPTSPSQSTESPSIATRIGLPANTAPRKIKSSEEVEDVDDAEEKQKIRQSMLNHGLQVPENQLKTQKRASTIGTFFTRVIGAGVMSSPTTNMTDTSKRDESSPSVSSKGELYPTPRLTTFDGPPLAMRRSISSSGKESDQSSSSPISRTEARQRALDVGSTSVNLTEIPHWDLPLSARRGKRRDASSASSASTSVGENSRGESVGGDESFQYKSPSLDVDSKMEGEEGASTWGKTFKRMSLLGSKNDRPS